MSEKDRTHYKTLISGTLVQLTAFSTGGRNPHGRVDSPVARDGQGRLTLRGSGLAGAFISTASRLFGDKLPREVTAGAPGEQVEWRREARAKDPDADLPRLPESVWRFHTSHPLGAPQGPALEVRSGVGIRQDTGAAAEGLKYEVETVPAGTRWPFLLEVDEYRDPEHKALPIALHVIDAWCGICVLGRNVARGLGWMRIDTDSLKILRLDPEDADLWPDANRTPAASFTELARDKSKRRLLDEPRRSADSTKIDPKGIRPYHGTGTIEIGAAADEDTWGLDTLSVGASEAIRDLQDDALASLVESHPAELDPDIVLAWTRQSGRKPHPFIPGSGLRGPLRHSLSWWRRSRHNETVQDPNATAGRKALARKKKRDLVPIERLFGSGTYSGALLLSDAELEHPETFGNDAILFLEQHAEDEFTGGTYAEAKFNRVALVRGTFKFHYLIEADSEAELRQFRVLLAQLQALGKERQIPIGGANWRGHGWVRWSLELPPESEPEQADIHTDPEWAPKETPA